MQTLLSREFTGALPISDGMGSELLQESSIQSFRDYIQGNGEPAV
jgi:hypothetical protein